MLAELFICFLLVPCLQARLQLKVSFLLFTCLGGGSSNSFSCWKSFCLFLLQSNDDDANDDGKEASGLGVDTEDVVPDENCSSITIVSSACSSASSSSLANSLFSCTSLDKKTEEFSKTRGGLVAARVPRMASSSRYNLHVVRPFPERPLMKPQNN